MNIAIPIGFLILAIILLWFFINTKGKLAIKIALTLIAGYYSLVTWHSLDSYEGWPTGDNMPEEFILHWVVIHEPNKLTGDEGAIYVWLYSPEETSSNFLNFLGRKSGEPEPRAYKLPYSLPMHENAEKARGMLAKGKVVRGKRGKGKPGSGTGNGNGDEGKEGNGRRGGSMSVGAEDYEFHEVLPSILPDKN